MKKTDSAASLHKEADKLLTQHELDDAERVYTEIYNRDRNDTKALLELSAIDCARGKFNDAINKLQNSIKIDPDFYDAVYNLGKIYQSRGLLHEALDCFNHAAEVNPLSVDPQLLVSRINLQMNNYPDCESSCLKALEIDEKCTEALMILANTYIATGKHDQSINTYRTLISIKPDHAPAWYLLGTAYLNIGNTNDAINAIQQSLKLDSNNAQAQMSLGNIFIAQNKPEKALIHFKEAANIAPDYADAWNILISTYERTHKLEDMVNFCRSSIDNYPKNLLAWAYMGYALESLDEHDKALESYKRATKITKGRYDLWERMGSINVKLDRPDEALTCLQTALKYGSNNIHTHLNYAKILRSRGLDNECAMHCRHALEISPDYIPALIELGMVLIDQGQFKTAISYFNQAKDADPGNTEIASGLAQAYDRMGNHDEAFNSIRPLLESGCKDPGIACTYAKISAHIGKGGEAITLIEEILKLNHLRPSQRIDLHFMAGVLYDEAEKFTSAMLHFNKANSLKPTNFSPDGYARFIENIINSFSSKTFRNLPSSGSSDERPIFIVGMMRSGTSLVEQILASHDDVHGCGELMGMTLAAREIGLFQHIIDAEEPLDQLLTQDRLENLAQGYLEKLPPETLSAKRFTDKMPNNFLNLGLIALLFPNSRIIHTKRNPLDTCLSAYFINFSGRHDYAYSLENLGYYYRQYQKLMDHWHSALPLQILDVEYEDLVNNTEGVCHSIIDFCGLDWDEKVLNFHNSERLINTASYNQVRKPIYASSIGYWKNYKEHLEPLINALDL